MAGLTSILLAVGVVAGGAVSAASAASDFLQIDKTVDKPAPQPGDTFTYTVKIVCSEQDCLDAELSDAFPAELAGFAIENVAFTPSTVPYAATWSDGSTTSSTPPAAVGADTGVTVALQETTNDPVGVGMLNGSTFTMQVSLIVPADYPPGQDLDIVNTAVTSASNANTVQDSATIRVDAPVSIGVGVDKTWTPAQQTYAPGAASTIGLSVANTSNVDVDQLVIQEPQAAPDGAAALDPSNPFTITDFTGFGNVSVPAGCTSVQVDAYVFEGGTWTWRTGPPATELALPDGVTNDAVGGIRVTCDGDIPPGQAVTFDLGLAQRADDRDSGDDLSTDQHRVDNVAAGSATVAGQDPATDDDAASYTVVPAVPTVETTKNIQPGRITAGGTAQGTITAANGDAPVSELRLSDLDFFTEKVAFGGFSAVPEWPAGATAAVAIFHLEDGSAVEVPFGSEETPAAPSGVVTGFELVYTGDAIEPTTTTTAEFTIATAEDATGTASELALTNTVDADVRAPNGQTGHDDDDAPLVIVDPDIAVTLDKTVRPGTAVEPGQTVVASLETNATSTGDGATVHDIVVQDVWDGADDGFWNAFELEAIAPTQVPSQTELTIEVQDSDGTWAQLAVTVPQSGASVFQMTAGEVAGALASHGLTAADVEGIRFSFHNEDGFPADSTVTPNVVFEAQNELRNGDPVAPGDEPTTYTNYATAEAEGQTEGGTPLRADDDDIGTATVDTDPAGPGPGVGIDKAWTKDFVDAQSGQRADTNLSWSVSSGYSSVTISDPASDWDNTAATVFDAFDLVSIRPIAASSTPYSNGWYLKYDTVTAVQLYYSGDWHTVDAPDGTWMTESRGFKGYTLTPDELAGTTGVRLVLEETASDTAAREAAASVGAAFDPFAPAPGSGVGSGSTLRQFALEWQLRDITRSTQTSITAHTALNVAGADNTGIVDNTVQIAGAPVGGGSAVTDTDDDTIQILDQGPAVDTSKSVTPTDPIYTPVEGTDPSAYPTAQWTLSAHNASTAKASSIRLTDPATCTDTSLSDCQTEVADAAADPFDTDGDYLTDAGTPSPFDRFTATGITIAASIPDQVDLGASTVWLLHYSGGVYTTTQHTATEVDAMTETELADVVGVSVTFQKPASALVGTITQDNVLTVTIDSRLRSTLRSTGEAQVLAAGKTVDVVNRVFAQSYDPIVSPDTKTGDVADAQVTLTGGVVNIAPTKSVSPSLLTEPQRDAPVTVTLGANQGTQPRSTLSPAVVTIEDQAESPDFWNEFAFTGLGVVTLPAGADQVQVDVYDGTDWVEGTPAAAAALPAGVAASDVQGIRFTFSRVDGGLFASQVPAPNWSASAAFTVQLRDTYRDSGEAIAMDHTVANTQISQSTRPDGNDSDAKTASSQIQLAPGTHELAVNKLANAAGTHLVQVGSAVPFDLTIRNVGTGFLTVQQVSDQLPAELVYLDAPAPTYTKDADGLLSDDVSVALSADGRTVTFTWPDGGDRMKPGETFGIRLYLELQPGLAQGQNATNTMTAQTAETLDSCRNTVAGGSLTGDWANDPTTCGTTDYVGVVSGSNLYTVKGVRGSLPGAYNPSNAAATCAQSLTAAGGSYYRAPCVANSQVDGTDEWVLHTINAGTVPVTQMTIFDQLPTAGDQSLISDGSRGSQFRPELVADSLNLTAPAGTTYIVQATTSTGVCVGTWDGLQTSPVCEQNGEVWVNIGADDVTAADPAFAIDTDIDWTAVTGLRVVLDFAGTATGALAPGAAADVTFSTVNRLADADNPGGVSDVVPAADQLAWNQFGVKYQFAGESGFRKIAPSRVGTHVRFGAIEVTKVVTGPAAGYAPSAFTADVTCQAGDLPLNLGDQAVVTLDEANDYTVDIHGLPLSAEGTTCTVSEQGSTGEFGETSREGSPVTLTVSESEPVSGAYDVPTAQVATLVNDYEFTSLSVTKRVDTQATVAQFGPFAFSLSCTSATGMPVTFDDDGTTTIAFELEADGTWTAPADRIPVGASCALVETDESFADGIAIVGSNVVDNGDGTATVTPGIDPAEVEVTNGYDAGTVTVSKEVTGEGADLYGAGPFTFAVTCTYQGQTLFDDEITLRGGDTETFGPYPASTACAVEETATGGATETTLDPESGTVVVPSPDVEGGISQVTIAATNRFDLASFDIVKERLGNLANPGAAGPFTVAAVCTWVVDGEERAIDVPGGAERTLTAENGYRAVYGELPVGASCDVTETATGHAASTTITVDAGGEQTVTEGTMGHIDLTGSDEHAATMTVSNTFTAGELSVTKTVAGSGASAHVDERFEVTLACTWYGTTLEIPGGAVRELTVGDPVTYTDLPTDAECTVSETRTGGADRVTITSDGQDLGAPAVVTVAADTTVAVVITNQFDAPLASTGGDARAALLIAAGAIAALVAGALLVVRRRRRAE